MKLVMNFDELRMPMKYVDTDERDKSVCEIVNIHLANYIYRILYLFVATMNLVSDLEMCNNYL